MQLQDATSLRAIILQSRSRQVDRSPTGRLLSDLGLRVQTVEDPRDAMVMLSTDGADLMIVDIGEEAEREEFLGNLSSLPADRQPRHVTVFTDKMDASVQALRQRLSPSRLHIFLKPLHMHGLLSVLRNIDRAHSVSA